jgi:hypothetical protein
VGGTRSPGGVGRARRERRAGAGKARSPLFRHRVVEVTPR